MFTDLVEKLDKPNGNGNGEKEKAVDAEVEKPDPVAKLAAALNPVKLDSAYAAASGDGSEPRFTNYASPG